MAVAFRTSSTSQFVGGGTSAVVFNDPGNSGDLLIVIVSADNNAETITAPDGTWIPIALNDHLTTVDGQTVAVWYKKSAAGSGTYAFALGTGDSCGILMAFSGADPTNPINASAASPLTGSGSDPVTITAPTITTTVDGCELCTLFAVDPNTGTGTDAFTAPSAYTQQAQVTSTGGGFCGIAAAEKFQTTQGATGTQAGSDTRSGSATFGWVAYHIAIAPPAAAMAAWGCEPASPTNRQISPPPKHVNGEPLKAPLPILKWWDTSPAKITARRGESRWRNGEPLKAPPASVSIGTWGWEPKWPNTPNARMDVRVSRSDALPPPGLPSWGWQPAYPNTPNARIDARLLKADTLPAVYDIAGPSGFEPAWPLTKSPAADRRPINGEPLPVPYVIAGPTGFEPVPPRNAPIPVERRAVNSNALSPLMFTWWGWEPQYPRTKAPAADKRPSNGEPLKAPVAVALTASGFEPVYPLSRYRGIERRPVNGEPVPVAKPVGWGEQIAAVFRSALRFLRLAGADSVAPPIGRPWWGPDQQATISRPRRAPTGAYSDVLRGVGLPPWGYDGQAWLPRARAPAMVLPSGDAFIASVQAPPWVWDQETAPLHHEQRGALWLTVGSTLPAFFVLDLTVHGSTRAVFEKATTRAVFKKTATRAKF